MILEDRRKCKYEIGSFSLKNKTINNKALFDKCFNFYREIVGDVAVKNYKFDSTSISDVTIMDTSVPIIIAGEHFDIKVEPLSVWVDYYERCLEFHRGSDVNLKLKIDKLVIDVDNYGREEFADEFFRLLVTWYLPNRNIYTTIRSAGRYFPINLPISGSTVKSIEVSAVRGASSPKNSVSRIKKLKLLKEYDQDLGELVKWSICVPVYDGKGYQTQNLDEVIFSNKTFNINDTITFRLGGVLYHSKNSETGVVSNF